MVAELGLEAGLQPPSQHEVIMHLPCASPCLSFDVGADHFTNRSRIVVVN